MVLPDTAILVANRIFEKDEVRELVLRQGKELKSLEKGKANLEAALAQTRGEAAAEPCDSCKKASRPRGPFAICVKMADEFDGAYCNCRYNNEGTECTFHRKFSCLDSRTLLTI
jgi:hypothetical protein